MLLFVFMLLCFFFWLMVFIAWLRLYLFTSVMLHLYMALACLSSMLVYLLEVVMCLVGIR